MGLPMGVSPEESCLPLGRTGVSGVRQKSLGRRKMRGRFSVVQKNVGGAPICSTCQVPGINALTVADAKMSSCIDLLRD